MEYSDFKSICPLTVRWGDQDANRHINNVQFMRYLECGRVDYFSKLRADMGTESFQAILVDIQCTFLQQLHYPSDIEVVTRISRLGSSSFDLTAAIYRKGEYERPVATSLGKMACFDFDAQKSVRISETVREIIRHFEDVKPAE